MRHFIEDSVRISSGALTAGDERFKQASALQAQGRKDDAIRAFEQLRADYPGTWIDRVSRERLEKLRP